MKVQILFYRHFKFQVSFWEKSVLHCQIINIEQLLCWISTCIFWGLLLYSTSETSVPIFFFSPLHLEDMELWRGRLKKKSLISLCYHLQRASAGSESAWQCESQLATLRIHCQKSTARDRHSDLAGSIVQALLWQRRWCLAALRWARSQLTGSPCTLLSFTLHTDFCLLSCVCFYI